MAFDFKSVLSQPAAAIERPKPLPIGTYKFIILSYAFAEIGEKKTPCVEFTMQASEAADDVNADELKAAGGLDEKKLKTKLFLTEDALFRLKEFLIAAGCDDKNGAASLEEMLVESRTKSIGVIVKHRAGTNEGDVFTDVAKVFAWA